MQGQVHHYEMADLKEAFLQEAMLHPIEQFGKRIFCKIPDVGGVQKN